MFSSTRGIHRPPCPGDYSLPLLISTSISADKKHHWAWAPNPKYSKQSAHYTTEEPASPLFGTWPLYRTIRQPQAYQHQHTPVSTSALMPLGRAALLKLSSRINKQYHGGANCDILQRCVVVTRLGCSGRRKIFDLKTTPLPTIRGLCSVMLRHSQSRSHHITCLPIVLSSSLHIRFCGKIPPITSVFSRVVLILFHIFCLTSATLCAIAYHVRQRQHIPCSLISNKPF